MNERAVESLIEEALILKGFKKEDIQYQGSEDERIKKCLMSKSSNTPGRGRPEFIIKLNENSSDLLVIEVKANYNSHASKENLSEDDNLVAVKYAEDGIIHYLKGLRTEFNIIGLAISKNIDNTFKMSSFKALRNQKIERLKFQKLATKEQYLEMIKFSDIEVKKTEDDILRFARELNGFLSDNMELSEIHKPLCISGILLALKNSSFESSFRFTTNKDDLAENLINAIKQTLKAAKISNEKINLMMPGYQFFKNNISLKNHLLMAITNIYNNLYSLLTPNSSIDILGSFYAEFSKYSTIDQKGLGIVLTPRHITGLFAELADLNPDNSVVLDTCTGTGGFLIAAMSYMINQAHGDLETIDRIKSKGLIGVELDQHMFTLACTNMIFRGDGKANMFWDDSISPRDANLLNKIKEMRPNTALINPPYSKKIKGKSELDFILRTLDLLTEGGQCLAIVPLGAYTMETTENLELRRQLLNKHTLKAVIQMPHDLFNGVGTITAILVFEAHKPHLKDGKPRCETWLADWNDDGHKMYKGVKIEKEEGIWNKIKSEWLDAYFNQRVIPGISCKAPLTYSDEWVFENYVDADYSKVDEEVFNTIRDYLIEKLSEVKLR
jgi:type I restriction-modification system DNA methylase subunit